MKPRTSTQYNENIELHIVTHPFMESVPSWRDKIRKGLVEKCGVNAGVNFGRLPRIYVSSAYIAEEVYPQVLACMRDLGKGFEKCGVKIGPESGWLPRIYVSSAYIAKELSRRFRLACLGLGVGKCGVNVGVIFGWLPRIYLYSAYIAEEVSCRYRLACMIWF